MTNIRDLVQEELDMWPRFRKAAELRVLRFGQFKRSVRIMRVLCPLALIISLLLCAVAHFYGANITALVDAFLAGINLMLTWVQWRVFDIGD